MLLRRVLFLLALVTVLGCSGLTSLFVENHTNAPISGTVSTKEPPGKGASESVAFTIPPGERAETVDWYGAPPLAMNIEFSGGLLKGKHQIDRLYTEAMRHGTSGGAYFFLEVREDGMRFRDPDFADKVRRNPPYYFLPASCFGLVAVAFAWAVWRAIRSRRSG